MPPATQDAPESPVRCTRTDHPARAARRATYSPMMPPPMTASRPAGVLDGIFCSLRRHDPDQV
jgi:hypothetical protein